MLVVLLSLWLRFGGTDEDVAGTAVTASFVPPIVPRAPSKEARAVVNVAPEVHSAPVDAVPAPKDAGVRFEIHAETDSGIDLAQPASSAAVFPGREEPDAGSPISAESQETDVDGTDRRFKVRWSSQGLCAQRPRESLKEQRSALLASFVPRQFGEAHLLADSRVDTTALNGVAVHLAQARVATQGWVDFPSNVPPPTTIVYFDAPQLRSVACVSEQTVGYFDGALHIAADPALSEASIGQTVVHEYVHFALNALKVPKPMWLHEGLAMQVAGENWWADARLDLPRWIQGSHFPFDAMVFAFPHTADEKFALAAYYQSFRMVGFVVEQRGPLAIRQVVSSLAAQAISADDAFAFGAGLEPASLEAHWRAHVSGP